jgi:hypothetical protein
VSDDGIIDLKKRVDGMVGGEQHRNPQEVIRISGQITKAILPILDGQPMDCCLNSLNNVLCQLALHAKVPVEFLIRQVVGCYEIHRQAAQAGQGAPGARGGVGPFGGPGAGGRGGLIIPGRG